MTLPKLHLVDWRPTKDTLHLYCQIVGKVRLATTPPRNQWWNAPLYVDVRGLTTRRLHHKDTTFQIDFDFVDHSLNVRTADGRTQTFALADGVPVADFDARLHEALRELGVDVDDQGAAVRRAHDDTVPRRPGARVVGSRRDRALRPHPRLVRRGVRGVQRLVQRQDEPRPSLLAQLRPCRHAFLGAGSAPARGRRRHARGVLAGGHLVRLLGGDDNLPDAAYYSYTAPEPDGLRDGPLPAGDWVSSPHWLARDPSLRVGPHRTRPARERSCVLASRLRGGCESSPAGKRAASNRAGVRPRSSCTSCRQPRRKSSADQCTQARRR